MPKHPPLPVDLPTTWDDDADLVLRHLRTLSEDALVGLLVDRPELLRGAPPADLEDLAERLAHPGYLGEAVRDLDVSATIVLNVVLMLGRGASVGRLVELLDPHGASPDEHEDAVLRRVGELLRLGVVVRNPSDRLPDGLVVVPGIRTVVAPLLPGISLEELLPGTPQQDLSRRLRAWGLSPGSNTRRSIDHRVRFVLTDPDLVETIASWAGEELFAGLMSWALGTFAAEPPARTRAESEAGRWAVEVGLAWTTPWGTPELPREVVLGLLRGSFRHPFPTRGPELPTVEVSPDAARRAAAGSATELLTTMTGVVEHVARTPVPCRKDDTVGSREVTRLAKALRADVRLVRISLFACFQLGLLAWHDASRITTSPNADAWRRLPPARRLADVLEVWWQLGTLVVRDRDLDGGAAAIGGVPTGYRVVEVRRALLQHLTTLPDGFGATSGEALFRHVGWSRPNDLEAVDAEIADDVLAEAELLGAVAAGTLSGLGHALLAGNSADLVREAELLLPGTTDRASFGSDLTVLVAGTPAAHVVDLLDTVADRESRGAANQWRFTDASFRAALDAGYAVEDLLAGLRELSDKPLPQPVEYFAQDVARRYGRVSVRAAGAVIVGDEALVAELVAHSGLRRLGLHVVAPTVALSVAPHDVTLEAVRKVGYLPRPENPDGTPGAAPITLQRSASPDASVGEITPEPVPSDPGPNVQAEGLRLFAGAPASSDPVLAELLGVLVEHAGHLTTSEQRQLGFAIARDRPVSVFAGTGYARQWFLLTHPVLEGTRLGDGRARGRHELSTVRSVAPR